MKKFIYKRNKLTRSKQAKLLRLMADLMHNGFSLQEGLRFMVKLYYQNSFLTAELEKMLHLLAAGHPIDEAFAAANFLPIVSSEIKLSEIHGELVSTLDCVSHRLTEEQEKVSQLRRLLSYPCLLIVFVLVLLIAMKLFLFPKITLLLAGKDNLGFQIINHFFIILGGLIVLIALGYWLFYRYFCRHNGIERNEILLKIPFVRYWCVYQSTCYFCDAWGSLLKTGIETRQIVNILKQDDHVKWMSELAVEMEKGLEQGFELSSILKSYSFFYPGLIHLVKAGEVKAKLGDELLMYGQELWKEWIQLLEKWMEWVQPLIFILIGILIICMYAAVLLPMYTGLQ